MNEILKTLISNPIASVFVITSIGWALNNITCGLGHMIHGPPSKNVELDDNDDSI